ncbi:T cell receptor beta variable 19 [Brachyhypopomus gauderio]|uniref:T cell receptor beta variable 19 n=1 Tax=Brachyhypopomus gauderio TaxID=698409 RepID=UPI00404246A5
MTGLFMYTLWICVLRGSSEGVLITQWPKYISSTKNTSVDMHCYQNNTDYDYTYWYRQVEGKEPVLVARYVARSDSYEEGFKTGFKVWGTEKKQWSLTVDVKEDSAAVYLCAASFHSE